MKIRTILNTVMLVIIVVFAGFVFWLGLENRELKENSVGIVYTKTSGWSEKVLIPGKFNWSFQKVIPTNYTLHTFLIETQNINFEIKDTLPSSNLYASFNSIEVDNFNYSFNFSGNIKLNSDYIPKLVQDGEFTQDNFLKWQEENIQKIKNILKIYISKSVIISNTLEMNSVTEEYISNLFPYYNFRDIYINIKSPDMELYEVCRKRYIQNIETQTSADEEYLVQSLKQQNEEQLKLDLLKKYGEIFTSYPIMIEYLKIDTDMVLDRATMEDFISPQYQK